MKRIFLALLLALSAVAEAQVAYSDLLGLELSAWRARAGFHQLSLNGNAPQDLESLEKVLSKGATLVERIRSGADASQSARAGELVGLWEDLTRRAMDNPMATLGYADFNAFSELNTLVITIVGHCRALAEQSGRGAHDSLLETGVVLQRLASEYLALSAFPSAGINTGTTEPALNFSEESLRFEKGLVAEEARYRNDDRMRRTLGQTRTRWQFIRNAVQEMDNPDSSKVPLLFHRYSSQITSDLMALLN